jgi:hypothetical protein
VVNDLDTRRGALTNRFANLLSAARVLFLALLLCAQLHEVDVLHVFVAELLSRTFIGAPLHTRHAYPAASSR